MARSLDRIDGTVVRLAAILALIAPASAANVIVVNANGGAGVDFTTLSAALAAAQNGDIVLLQTPDVAAISGPSIALVVDAGVTGWSPIVTLGVSGTTAGRPLLVQGFGSPISASNCSGLLWLDDCAVLPAPLAGSPAALVLSNASSVVLGGCNFSGAGGSLSPIPPGPGVIATQSSVHAFDSGFRGGSWLASGSADGQGAPGLRMQGGSLYASGCGVLGGALLAAFPWLKSGDGLELSAGAVAQALDCAFAPGPAAFGGQSGVAVDTTAGGTFSTLPGTARRLTCTSPVREGQVAHIQVFGAPGELAWIDVATAPAALPLAGIGELLLDPAKLLVSAPIGALPASGTKSVDVAIQPLGTEGVVLYLQPHFVDAQAQVSLGSARALVLLSAAL